jgi:hypothetical protein
MKKKANTKQHVGSSAFVLVGFATFFLMFISLGEGRSFRTNRLDTQVTTKSGASISKENQEFINTYMPHFEDFALHYNYEYSSYENYIR